MASRLVKGEGPSESRRRTPTTPEGRELRLSSLALDAIERRIKDGTASAQELVFFAKAGSPREQLEKTRLEYENELTRVKIEAMESAKRTEEMYAEALIALRGYSGQDDEDESDEA